MTKENNDLDLAKLTDMQLVEMRDRTQEEKDRIQKEIARRLMKREQQSK